MIFHDVLGKLHRSQLPVRGSAITYLYFNTSPSSNMLMGDAGSNGYSIAILAMQSRHPFIYLLMAGVMIVDGESLLSKYFYSVFLKIAILKKYKNTAA